MNPRPRRPARVEYKPRRLTLSEIVEQLLQRSGAERSSVSLTRNAKGATQIEVVVRTGDTGAIQTIEAAETVATQVYDRLRNLYPLPEAETPGGEAAS